MTMPHLMNCAHRDDGWCGDCVRAEWEKNNPHESSYERRIRLPLRGDTGLAFEASAEFETLGGVKLAVGYDRIVIGERGPYVEFQWRNFIYDSVKKVDAPHRYYIEWRTSDGVKVYEQVERVTYADYLPGRLYVSPFELKASVPVLVTPLARKDRQASLDWSAR